MTKFDFNFMSLLLIMLIVINGILILHTCCMLVAIKIKLNISNTKLNFKIFLLTILHPIIYFTVDNDKMSKISFMLQMVLITFVIDNVRCNVKDNMEYLFKKYEEDLKG